MIFEEDRQPQRLRLDYYYTVYGTRHGDERYVAQSDEARGCEYEETI